MDSNNIDDIKDNVKDIRSASRDLIDVINGMIDLSIIESGNLEIIEENYNVYDMFEDVKNIAESKMRDKNVELKIELDNLTRGHFITGETKCFLQFFFRLF